MATTGRPAEEATQPKIHAQVPARGRSFPSGKWLRHPLFVALVGTIASIIIVPHFARQWQDRQKEREVKQQLVASMGAAVTEALKTSQFINLDLFGQAAAPGQEGKVSQQVYNRVQIQWEIRSAKINSQLRAYFPSTDLGQSWHRYSEVVTKAYQLVARLHDDRSGHLRDIRKYLGSGGSAIKWDALKDDTPTSEYATAFQAEYGKLITVMFARKDKIIQDVLDANAAGFDTSLWP